jgi:hypothetical protein
MAGRTRTRASRSTRPQHPNRALVASSAYYTGAQAPLVYGTDKGWQAECYRFYSIIGEARYAAQYYGNSLSKCEMFMANPVIDEKTKVPKWEPSYDSPEAAFLDDVFVGKANQSEMLHGIGVHLTVGGELFVIGYVADRTPTGLAAAAQSTPGDGSMIWGVYSPLEVNTQGRSWTLKFEGAPDLVLGEFDVVIRIWRADPYLRNHADSPFKSMLPVLAEIEKLTMHIQAQLISRLAGAGIMWVPEGIDFPDMPLGPGATDEEKAAAETANGPTKLMRLIAEAGATALRNQGHPSTRVPIIIQVPDNLIEYVGKVTTFWSELDEKAQEMREGALHRFASGMDLPNESTEGMASNGGTGGGSSNGVSHWGAWQIEESAIKIHIEPAMELVVSAFTVDYIRIQVPRTKMVVQFSTAKLRLRPDRSKEALELYGLGVLNRVALLRETGFNTTDLMSDDELKTWLMLKIAGGSNTPEQVAAAANAFGLNLPASDPTAETTQAPPPPSLEEHPIRPRDPSERVASLIPVCNAMVLQALSRVGNRLIQRKVRPPEGVATYSVHTYAPGELDATALLVDAFPMANEMLDGLADPADVMPTLQRYTAALVATGAAHDRGEMTKWLERMEIEA